ncbi:hypothetical protein ACTXT7_017185 [Hymenolepis weldensis]
MLSIRTLTCIGISLLIVVIFSSSVESKSLKQHNRGHLSQLKEVGKEEDLHLAVRKTSSEISPKSSKTGNLVASKKKGNNFSIFSFFNLSS